MILGFIPYGYKYVLVEKCLEKPENAPDDQVSAYDKWVKADEMAKCYILASMENVLQHQHQSMTSAFDMLESLKEIFGEEYVLKMMSFLNKLEILGVVIDKEYQVEMLLNELQAAETIIKQQAPPMESIVDKPSSSNPRGSQKKKKPRKVQDPRVAHGANGGVAKPKGKCFHCKQPDHHKKQCPGYLAKIQEPLIMSALLLQGFRKHSG
ncbi:hypothetical protein KY290_013392 [Solanum tuberosum]|uniref:CCHC-type domain-containing protein n=1 Tax=Solanum tuberosum TaxID=4113 RepID=A0ABQ7VMW5_SOLTU|nr:hypothetical protein KY285_012855 [Solanum tuberosum]KAH0769411.1 hypothetical protein KY290_013392 [Solanum tuberosum]